MNLKTPISENYAATVVEIKTLVPLANCDNVVHTNIFGNLVIVSKDTKMGEKGIFFPVETALSSQYLCENNLYRNNTCNKNLDEKGYFEENGRIRCVKFRGNKSEGIFMPISSLIFAASISDLATLKVGDTFDHLNGISICKKYVPKSNTEGTPGSKQGKLSKKKESRLVEGQFRFHIDTSQLGKNIFKVLPDSLISITSKFHGTSVVVSKLLTKRRLSWFDRVLKSFGVKILDIEYNMIYSSRKVIKNDFEKDNKHYYKDDIWKLAADQLKDSMPDGMTIYAEIVGFTPSGQAIQKGYDYGCTFEHDPDEYLFDVYIYRITYTNWAGKVFEFSAKQVQDWCKQQGLNAVPEYFYGYARNIYPLAQDNLEKWQELFLSNLKTMFNMEKDCEFCTNKVPAEGIVLQIEGPELEVYKLKSSRFLEWETKQLDKGEIDIESEEV